MEPVNYKGENTVHSRSLQLYRFMLSGTKHSTFGIENRRAKQKFSAFMKV